jgi:hypothetical protein
VSVQRVEPGPRRAAAWIAVVVVALLCATSTGGARAAPSGARPLSSEVPCAGSILPANYTGLAVVRGGSEPGRWADYLPLTYSTSLEQIVTNVTTGSVVSVACVPQSAGFTTNATGAFSLAITPPATQCAPGDGTVLCTSWSGPYVGVSVALATSVPGGYEFNASLNGTRFTLCLAALLASVQLPSVGGTVFGAPSAPVAVHAVARTGLGAPSPVSLEYAWNLSGAGWALTHVEDNGSTAIVQGDPGAGVGELSVVATTDPALTFALNASNSTALRLVPTQVGSATSNRTVVDVGSSVRENVVARGAPGLAYTGTFDPGRGSVPVLVACDPSASGNGTTSVVCTAELRFSTPGPVVPTVQVTNGYSSATAALPELNVTLPPVVEIGPAVPTGYAGVPLPISVRAMPGAGVAPFEDACLATGTVDLLCSDTPGPAWQFDPVYPAPGNFSVTAWIVDADGLNRSGTATVEVVPPLALSAPPGVLDATVGEPAIVPSAVAGGVLPGRFWWNETGAATPTATGAVTADGPLSFTVVPVATGALRFTLTVVDALGTAAAVSAVLSVAAAPVTDVRPVAPGATPSVVVGTGTELDWEALDPAGGTVPTFSSAAELRLVTGPSSSFPGWVNATGLGPLTASGIGTIGVPAGAWAAGRLNLSVTPGAAGTFSLVLEGPGLPGPTTPVTLVAVPDRDHLVLSDPLVALRGERENATRWDVTDRYGDPTVGALLIVEVASPTGEVVRVEPAAPAGDGDAAVWINYTAGALGATVRVLDPAGDVLLGPIVVPAVSTSSASFPSLVPLGISVPIGASVAGIATVLRRRPSPTAPPALEEELARLADGRAGVLDLVGRLGSADFDTLVAAWDPPPAPAELGDWIASLVTDGTLEAVPLHEDAPGWRIATPRTPVARVTLDPDVLDRAIARREEDSVEDDGRAT